eukprot:1160142-Pelagomonas_calceolata.AAC.7
MTIALYCVQCSGVAGAVRACMLPQANTGYKRQRQEGRLLLSAHTCCIDGFALVSSDAVILCGGKPQPRQA